MINYIQRKDLDVLKYNSCIENAIQSRIYAYSWYLDIVAANWDVLILNDYEAVMPIAWKRKYGIKYVYPLLWVLELGVFYPDNKIKVAPFLDTLFNKFRFVESKLNSTEKFISRKNQLVGKQFQTLSLKEVYPAIFSKYRKDRKKDIGKAIHLDLTEKWNDKPDKLITLFKNNVGKRTPNILEHDYTILENLILACLERKVGEILSIYDKNSDLVASGFFLKHKNAVTILVSSTDFKNRNNGANTFLIDRAVFKFQKNFGTFNFGGSSMKSIAKYFLSFGAKTEDYQQMKYNKLPYLLRFFKK
ncbi:MAG: hypothetical protein ACI9XR_002676 [Flavobacterium sp.]|jgi:hypothetical protein